MTIYTHAPPSTEKKAFKDLEHPEVVTEPLTSFKDVESDEVEAVPKVVRVTYFPRSRRSFCIHLLLTITVLVILACGAIGAVVFYRHLNKKEVMTGRCGVYFDASYNEKTDGLWADSAASKTDYFEEEIEVSKSELFESLYTPRFGDVRETNVWHDFQKNYTGLIDHEWGMCYVMKLNRSQIAPPKDLFDLVNKVMNGYYLPEAKVLQEDYRVVIPALTDLTEFGPGINSKCKYYDTFWLMKLPTVGEDERKKRAAENEKVSIYAIVSNFMENPFIVKIKIHSASKDDEK